MILQEDKIPSLNDNIAATSIAEDGHFDHLGP